MVQTAERRWKTKPLECWRLFKEGTVTMFKHMGEEKSQKEYLVIGNAYPGAGRTIAGHPFAAQVAGRGLAATADYLWGKPAPSRQRKKRKSASRRSY